MKVPACSKFDFFERSISGVFYKFLIKAFKRRTESALKLSRVIYSQRKRPRGW